MKIALIGNPNCGKTTIFNALTGLSQRVGNWSGVTVERKEGLYTRDKGITIVDLPGIYSLEGKTEDERVASQFVQQQGADVYINIVDSTCLNRALQLTLELLDKKIPFIIALNMTDELDKQGARLDVERMEKLLGIACLQTSGRQTASLVGLVERASTAVQNPAWRTLGDLPKRQAFIARHCVGLCGALRPKLTLKIDAIVCNRWLAFPIFAVVIWLMYYVSIALVGRLCSGFLGGVFDRFDQLTADWLSKRGAPPQLVGLVGACIVGVSAVVEFVPQIATLFLFVLALEACGYMARVAFIMDRIFSFFGLSGRAFVPLVVGCGCYVPAVMCCRTLGAGERKRAIMLTPFVPCSAKLPVFGLIGGMFFPHSTLAAPSMYFLGLLVIFCSGFVLRLAGGKKAQSPYAIELPPYRLPRLRDVLVGLYGRVGDFLSRAGTVIFVGCVAVWFLSSFDFGLQMVEADQSMLADLGRLIAPLFLPLGFGYWQPSVALLSGLLAKESIVSTLGILLPNSQLATMLTPQSAYAFMAFVLLSAPCLATIATIRQELASTRQTLLLLLLQTLTAYTVALLITLLGNLLSILL